MHHRRLQMILTSLCVLSLVACSHSPPASNSHTASRYLCGNAELYQGLVVGNGHCVDLIKRCSGAPATRWWRAGNAVMELPPGSIAPGSIIATFRFGRYPNHSGYHAAIYIKHDSAGIWVWDQWLGKPVHQRLIRARHDGAAASNNAFAYRLVL